MPSHRAHCSTACMDGLQNQPRRYRTRVQSNLWDRNTSRWGEKKHPQDKFTYNPLLIHNNTGNLWICLWHGKRTKDASILPADFCSNAWWRRPNVWLRLIYHAMISAISIGCLCVCGRQLSLKLVTVQPPTCQLNGLFICLWAIHYGPEQSQTTDGSQFFPFPFNAYEKKSCNSSRSACSKAHLYYTHAHKCTDMVTLSKIY